MTAEISVTNTHTWTGFPQGVRTGVRDIQWHEFAYVSLCERLSDSRSHRWQHRLSRSSPPIIIPLSPVKPGLENYHPCCSCLAPSNYHLPLYRSSLAIHEQSSGLKERTLLLWTRASDQKVLLSRNINRKQAFILNLILNLLLWHYLLIYK